jgi:hypothetical protein
MLVTKDRTAGVGMNKPQRSNQQPKPAAPPAVKAPETFVEKPSTPRKITIHPHRHCPICWSGRGGYGTAYSKQGKTTYYRCDQTTKPEESPCGHTWSVVLRIEAVRIEHRIVENDGER